MSTSEPRRRERVRVPPPLIPRRLASGRGATEQPNVTDDGPAALTTPFWIALIATGILAGLFGIVLMFVLRMAQHLGFGYDLTTFTYLGPLSFQQAVEQAPGWRRLASLAVAGVFGGVAWYLLRRYTPGEKTDVEDSVWTGTGELSFRRSLGTSFISIVVVGLGASLGREAGPRLMGAASGSVLGRWRSLSPPQRRLLVACGAGAGLAAVYNVPLGGALFIAEVLWGEISVPVLLPALACCGIATGVSWLYIPHQPTYHAIPNYPLSPQQLIWALLAGPLIGLAAVGFVRLIGWVSAHHASGRQVLVAPLGAFMVLGVVSLAFPQLLGNGRGMAEQAFLGETGLVLLAALFVLKPLVTALCLGSGASGGLFTPTLSTGAMLGGALGEVWNLVWPGAPSGAYALLGAAAMLGAAMQAPVTAIVITLELTGTGIRLAVPMILATVLATLVARVLDGYSIYSARLAAHPRAMETPPPPV